jgi:effector-binding domain-containing protein
MGRPLICLIKFISMRIKEVKPISFLYFRTQTKVNELAQYALVGQELFREAVNHKLNITGPVHWHYFGFEGDLEKEFTLEISLPVSDVVDGYDGKFHFKRTDAFKCVALEHEGSWLSIPESYNKAFGFISENQLQPVAANREIYVNVDFRDPDANTTEIQIGIK